MQVGKLLGVRQVIIGSCQINDEKIKITARIVEVETGKILKNSVTEYNNSLNDPFQVQKEFSLLVLEKLKKSL